jgi:uncharacterized SAM-binding protein YcdF (DUF218 family)
MVNILIVIMNKKAITDTEYHPDGFLKKLFIIAGIFFMIQVGFAVFGVPRAIVNWLKCADIRKVTDPAWIVVLGGSGIPSTTTLIRSYYGAYYAVNHPQARCIVALPVKGKPEGGSVGRMKNELILRGVAANRIEMEHKGLNTYQQAENVFQMIGPARRSEPIVIVTSPYHMRRAYLCFKKAGFNVVGCLPANSTGSEDDYKQAVVAWSGFPNIGHVIGNLRYGLWSNMTAQVWISRELLGLLVYKLHGWI